jgi:HPt (histidine-containing phosphotransfer) domain-containing protein
MEMMVDHELNELKREFLDEAKGKVAEMRSALDARADGQFEKVGYLAHQLKGSGGSYGYQQITTIAAGLEELIESLEKQPANGQKAAVERRIGELDQEIQRASTEL